MNVLTVLANAQDKVKDTINNLPNSSGVAGGNLNNVIYWVMGAAGLVAVGVIVYGAIKYLTSQGDPGKAKQASQIIAYAIIGLIVVMLATAITYFALNVIGGSTS